MFNWYREITPTERKTFWGCFSGWALDALDVQMFSLAIPALIAAFSLNKAEAGLISGVTLVASALGGWVMGAASDRIGRVRALQLTIVWFSLFTLLSAFAQSFNQLLVLKALQGFGFGGEWAAGAVLMAEIIRPEHRGKAMGMVQSAWAVGWAGSVLLYSTLFLLLSPDMAWRVMFGIGILPAFLIIYIRRNIPEPATFVMAQKKNKTDKASYSELFAIFKPDMLRMTLIGALIGVGAHGGYYALMTWLPTFLKTERHLSVLGTSGYLAVIIVAFWCGCMVSAYLLDRIGRRLNLILFSGCCVITVLAYVFLPLGNTAMLFLGFPLGFFAAGIPASLGALFNELYPSGVRGTGVGFCYNFGRIVSAGFPILVGHMSSKMSLGTAIGIDAALAYSLVVLAVLALPETRGKNLNEDAPVTENLARTETKARA
ncbi:Predicted arabinose efflux permease, MFS family [Collimonas sp. OK607]|uniref:MFS transporter n=1 Tax=Collimonas sp. OK607 TaxID=1798194 RepID=UPI0008E52A71|nr:MFS transporter [Collimonas sp. OK607]SFA68747.1 Predicted arabinose efflux permease, MFS family [Collimonas sp. OK607]